MCSGAIWRLPHLVEFGDATWSLGHHVVAGSRDTMMQMLRDECRGIVSNAPPICGVPSANEVRFIDSLAGRQPTDQQPGRWALYEYGEPLPIVVATQWRQSIGSGRARTRLDFPRPARGGLGHERPAGPGRVDSVLLSASATAGESKRLPLDLPLPPGSERLLCLRVAGGGSMLSFRGPADPKAWQAYFSSWLRAARWGSCANVRAHPDGMWQTPWRGGPGAGARRRLTYDSDRLAPTATARYRA